MPFEDEMRKLSAEYDYNKAHEEDKLVDKELEELKSYISAKISRGEKNVSEKDHFLFGKAVENYVDIKMLKGLLTINVTWTFNDKFEYILDRLQSLAAEEGIQITDYTFSIGYSRGDDSEPMITEFHKHHGKHTILRPSLQYWPNDLNPEDWDIYVKCDFNFSV